jgi:hypothetical protein
MFRSGFWDHLNAVSTASAAAPKPCHLPSELSSAFRSLNVLDCLVVPCGIDDAEPCLLSPGSTAVERFGRVGERDDGGGASWTKGREWARR